YGVDSDKYVYVFGGGPSPALIYRLKSSDLGLGNATISIRPLPDVDNDTYRDFAIIAPNASQVGEQVVLWDMFNLNITNTSPGSLPDYSYTTVSYFLNAGAKVYLPALWAGLGLIVVLLVVKVAAKIVGVWPLTRRFGFGVRESHYSTML
ncbi:MAG TPA: hypothetical protein PLO51_04550, partial [Candidatus Micrarchaeota archaeon]|nr:hypothetical protein [Candidatus Micrarchaeota archaeon]